MRWQRGARLVVAAIGVGCGVAIFLYARNRPAPPPPRSLASIDPKSKAQTESGTTLYLRAGKATVDVSFGATTSYDDGRVRLERVEVRGLEGNRYAIRADVLETAGQSTTADRPIHYDFTGHVVLTTDDGLQLLTEKATYDEAASRLEIPGAVTFTKGLLSGRGVGATYDRERNAFTFLDQSAAHVEPDGAGRGAVDATSKRMTLVREQRMLLLDQNARIAGDAQTLTSRTATVSFTEDERAVKYVELLGAARVVPKPDGAADRPAMNADKITMSFYEDGVTLQHAALTGQAVLDISGGASRSIHASWIDFTTGSDGRTLTSLRARDQVVVDLAATAETGGRQITADLLSASGDEKKGLTSARFEGSPSFTESPVVGRGSAAANARPRRGTATTLALVLGGQLDAIESAEFQQNARFQDGDITGLADVAQYEEAKGRLRLLPNPREPRRKSNVTTADMTVDGWTIDVWTTSQDLTAQGNVTTQMTRAAGRAGDAPGSLFGGPEPVNGGAETLAYTKSTGTAVYTGIAGSPARLLQGSSRVVADRIVYADLSHNLTAEGQVDSTWVFDAPGGESALKRYGVRADTLTYDDAARTAVYKGSIVTLAMADGDVEARIVTFRLAAASRALESMRAEQQAWGKLSGGHEVAGDVLTYQAETDVYILEGRPGYETARVKSPKAGDSSATPTTCTLTEGMKLELNKRTGAIGIPGEGQAPRKTIEVSCATSLRRSK